MTPSIHTIMTTWPNSQIPLLTPSYQSNTQQSHRKHGFISPLIHQIYHKFAESQTNKEYNKQEVPYIAPLPRLVHPPRRRVVVHDPPVGIRQRRLPLHPPFHLHTCKDCPQEPPQAHQSSLIELAKPQIFSVPKPKPGSREKPQRFRDLTKWAPTPPPARSRKNQAALTDPSKRGDASNKSARDLPGEHGPLLRKQWGARARELEAARGSAARGGDVTLGSQEGRSQRLEFWRGVEWFPLVLNFWRLNWTASFAFQPPTNYLFLHTRLLVAVCCKLFAFSSSRNGKVVLASVQGKKDGRNLSWKRHRKISC